MPNTILLTSIILGLVGIVVMNIKGIFNFIFTHLCNFFWYSVKIEESSRFYHAIQKYVVKEKLDKVHNFYYRNIYDSYIEGDHEDSENLLFNHGYVVAKFLKNRVLIEKSNEKMENSHTPFKNTKQTIHLFSFSRKSIDTFLKYIQITYQKSRIQYYFIEKNEVRVLGKIVSKTFDKIFMNDNIVENIKKDLDVFSASEQLYKNLGLKYKRTYLFYGEAGTGKSSLGTAIANYTLRDVVSINITKDMYDSTLINIIATRPNRAIILFEDIDCLFDNLNRKDEEKKTDGDIKVTLSCILNILDGAYTPNDVIFVLITNHIEKLDDAIKRDGRTDVLLEIKKPNLQTKQRYLEFVRQETKNPNMECDINGDVTISTIQKELFK